MHTSCPIYLHPVFSLLSFIFKCLSALSFFFQYASCSFLNPGYQILSHFLPFLFLPSPFFLFTFHLRSVLFPFFLLPLSISCLSLPSSSFCNFPFLIPSFSFLVAPPLPSPSQCESAGGRGVGLKYYQWGREEVVIGRSIIPKSLMVQGRKGYFLILLYIVCIQNRLYTLANRATSQT